MQRLGRTGPTRAATTALMVGAALLVGPPATGAQEPEAEGPDSSAARSDYLASCARCHGVDGRGGEGPPLARAVLSRAPDDEALIRIMREGIAGTAMPGAWWLTPADLERLARFVRSLAPHGEAGAYDVTGDAAAGRALYVRLGCDGCHTVDGFGTARGPDLTAVGARRGPAYLRESIVDPAAALPRGLTAMPPDFVDYLMVRIEDENGRVVRGMRMNEDTYTIQLKDRRGTIRSYYKPALRALERQFDRSLMQSYRDRLTDRELQDLVAYLMSLTGVGSRGVS